VGRLICSRIEGSSLCLLLRAQISTNYSAYCFGSQIGVLPGLDPSFLPLVEIDRSLALDRPCSITVDRRVKVTLFGLHYYRVARQDDVTCVYDSMRIRAIRSSLGRKKPLTSPPRGGPKSFQLRRLWDAWNGRLRRGLSIALVLISCLRRYGFLRPLGITVPPPDPL